MMIESLKKSLKYCFLLLIVSCSVTEPVIKENKWDINVIKDLEKDIIYESLSVFVNCYDDDGEDDIDVLFIIDDESGIYWELEKDNWLETTVLGDRWIGSNSIIMPDYSQIPRNSLRINIRDMAGKVAEDKLYITKNREDYSTIDFPKLKINNDIYSLTNYDEGMIYIYSENEVLIASGHISDEAKAFKDIFNMEMDKVESGYRIFVSVKNGDLNLESGPW